MPTPVTLPTISTAPRNHIMDPIITVNDDGSITGEYTPDSGELAYYTTTFSAPEWRDWCRMRYTLTTRTMALRMRALTMLTHDNQNLHSLVRLRAQLVNA